MGVCMRALFFIVMVTLYDPYMFAQICDVCNSEVPSSDFAQHMYSEHKCLDNVYYWNGIFRGLCYETTDIFGNAIWDHGVLCRNRIFNCPICGREERGGLAHMYDKHDCVLSATGNGRPVWVCRRTGEVFAF